MNVERTDALTALDAIPREHLAAAIARLAARAMEPAPVPEGPPAPQANGKLLVADDVAARLHVSKRWVYRHADALHAVRLSEAKVRFTEEGIERYLARARGRAK
jgi:hypothetical protein